MSDFAIGIDLGGTRIKSARFTLPDGGFVDSLMTPTRDGETEGDLPAFAHGVRQLVDQHEQSEGRRAKVIGISAPGLAHRDGRAIHSMPGKLLGLEGLLWADLLQHPGAHVLNDAHAALLGEAWCGAAKGRQHVVMLTLGTGVGGAVLADGRLLQGALGRAGHLGHLSLNPRGPLDICNTPGSLELAIGNATVGERSGGRFRSTHDLIAAVRGGDGQATRLWHDSLQALAAGVVSVINAFDPEVILIGGGIANAWDMIEPVLNRHLDIFEWRPGGYRVPILHASLGEWAGCYGAVQWALENAATGE